MARQSKKERSEYTILVVDDQEEVLQSAKSLLEREGHGVLTALSGEQALALVKEQEIHLVLVDYIMPGMNGSELVKRIREVDPFVQIIMQTGYAGEKDVRSVLADLDIQGYHDKADGPEKLLQWVDIALKGHRSLHAARESERRLFKKPSPTGSKILLVGDQPQFEVLATWLKREGCTVLRATTGADGLDQFVRERAQVLVVDDVLLRGGVDLVRRLRALDPALPIILVSEETDPERRRCLLHDVDPHGIHRKGDAPEQLLELIESALSIVRRLARTRADHDLRTLILAKFSHDVRNAIHVIHGYAEIIRSEPDMRNSEVITRLGGAADVALGLVQHYLDLARLESPGLVVRRERVSVDELLTDLRALGERQIGERPIRVATSAWRSEVVLYTDGEKLRAILAELLANGIKFSSEGTVRIDVFAAADGTQFVVQDTGPGVHAEEATILFDPFRQQRDDELASTPGQGLGLAIALRLTALLGGTLVAKRGPSGGALFTLSLPILAEVESASERVLH